MHYLQWAGQARHSVLWRTAAAAILCTCRERPSAGGPPHCYGHQPSRSALRLPDQCANPFPHTFPRTLFTPLRFSRSLLSLLSCLSSLTFNAHTILPATVFSAPFLVLSFLFSSSRGEREKGKAAEREFCGGGEGRKGKKRGALETRDGWESNERDPISCWSVAHHLQSDAFLSPPVPPVPWGAPGSPQVCCGGHVGDTWSIPANPRINVTPHPVPRISPRLHAFLFPITTNKHANLW